MQELVKPKTVDEIAICLSIIRPAAKDSRNLRLGEFSWIGLLSNSWWNNKTVAKNAAIEYALNMAGGGRMKYGHGGRGIGITKKGVKPCKMR